MRTWRRWKKRQGYAGPVEAGSVVDAVLERNGFTAELVSFHVVRHCLERLGRDFMKHMTPRSFRGGTLHCVVDSPVWNQQYTMMSEEILRRLNAEPCRWPIRAIRFSVGKTEENPYLYGDTATLEEQLAAVELTGDDTTCMQHILEGVDPALRETAGQTIELLFRYRRLKGIGEDES